MKPPRVQACGGCGRRLIRGRTCPHVLNPEEELGPVECDCPVPCPDEIGECGTCRRRVMP